MDSEENEPPKRRMCAVFPIPEKEMIENDCNYLKIEAEEAFCFEEYEKAMILLETYGSKKQHEDGIARVLFEYNGLYLKNLGVPTVSEKTAEEDKKQRPKSGFSRVLRANAIREIEGRSGTRGSTILKLFRQAFETCWETLGPDSLRTLLVQRHYYMELVTQGQDVQFRISENAKKSLVQNLKSKLGAEHRLLLELPNKLGLSDDNLPPVVIDAKMAFFDQLGRARRMLEAGAPGLALIILTPICTTALLADSVSDKKFWAALILKATARHVLGEATKGHVDLHMVKDLHRRFKASKSDKKELEHHMRDLDYIEDFQLDKARVVHAREFLAAAQFDYSQRHDRTVIVRAHERFEKVILQTRKSFKIHKVDLPTFLLELRLI